MSRLLAQPSMNPTTTNTARCANCKKYVLPDHTQKYSKGRDIFGVLAVVDFCLDCWLERKWECLGKSRPERVDWLEKKSLETREVRKNIASLKSEESSLKASVRMSARSEVMREIAEMSIVKRMKLVFGRKG